VIFTTSLGAQSLPDTIITNPENGNTLVKDTLLYQETDYNDTIEVTSLAGDTVIKTAENRTRIEAEIKRTARDSILQNIRDKKSVSLWRCGSYL